MIFNQSFPSFLFLTSLPFSWANSLWLNSSLASATCYCCWPAAVSFAHWHCVFCCFCLAAMIPMSYFSWTFIAISSVIPTADLLLWLALIINSREPDHQLFDYFIAAVWWLSASFLTLLFSYPVVILFSKNLLPYFFSYSIDSLGFIFMISNLSAMFTSILTIILLDAINDLNHLSRITIDFMIWLVSNHRLVIYSFWLKINF